MAEKVSNHDFIELNYTGKLSDGKVFDTTILEVAQKNHFHAKNRAFEPVIVCVGEKQLLPGLDANLEGKEVGKEFSITLQPEEAFGKKDVKKVQLVPLATFKEHKLNPHPGLQVDFDGKVGTVMRVSGGRVMVNFNHPLSGREVTYDCIITRKVTDPLEKVKVFVANSFGFNKQFVEVEGDEKKVVAKVPFEMPKEVMDLLSKKVVEKTGVKEVVFESSAVKKEQ